MTVLRAVVAALLSVGCAATPPSRAVERDVGGPRSVAAAREARGDASAAREERDGEARLVLAFAGDVIAHDAVKHAAARADVRGPDGTSRNHGGYDALLGSVGAALAGADLAFANLESPVTARRKRSGAMIFRADEEMVAALAAAGFGVLSVANNHAFDQGDEGLADTLRAVARHGLLAIGGGTSRRDACAPRFVERKGIRIALLARTLIMNFPEERPRTHVCMLAEGELKRAAREARASGAELVIASVHWGAEYWRTPHPEQVDSGRRIVAAGVDLLIGHHPHVLQPVERRRVADGRDTLIAYSLGNLLSNQGHEYVSGVRERDGDTRDVAILRVTVTRADDGTLRIADASAVALWTERTAEGDIALVPAITRRERVSRALGAPLWEAP